MLGKSYGILKVAPILDSEYINHNISFSKTNLNLKIINHTSKKSSDI